MSAVTNNVLKQLSDLSAAADSIVEENASDSSRLSEWAAIVRNAADNIVKSGSSSENTAEIPNLISFVSGKSRRGRRVSTVLTEMRKKHLHGKKGRASTKRTSLKASIKTALPPRKSNRLSNLNKTIVTDLEEAPLESPLTIDLTEDTDSSTSSDEKNVDTTAPHTYSKGAISKTRRSSKRKSPSKVSLEKIKKAKLFVQLIDIKNRDQPIKNTKIEKKSGSPKPSIKTASPRRKSNLNQSIVPDSSKMRRSSKRKSSPEVSLEKVKKPRLFVQLTDIKDKYKPIKNTKIEKKFGSPKPSIKTASPRRKSNRKSNLNQSIVPDSSKMRRSSERKSSPEVSLEKVKKPRLFVRLTDIKDKYKPIKNTKIEKLTKISSGASNTSILKENRTLRSKVEKKQDKAVENRKNILALRQQKLQQNKRARDEKLEIQHTQKMNLEKTKVDKLRSGGGQGKFKTSKTSPKANVENETLAITASSGKHKDKETALKKIMAQMNLKKAGTSISKSNEKTPALKNYKHETEKRTLNTTYVTQESEPSTSGIKGKTVRDPNIINLKSTKAVSNDSKTETLKKGVKKTGKALYDEKKNLLSTPTTQKKGPESYAITPTRSSFVSYDISEIRSDSEEEEESSNSKPIPSWALGVHLRNALLQQHHHPIETDELFGNYFEPPDLGAIMGVKKKAYNKRTSSAVWNSSFL